MIKNKLRCVTALLFVCATTAIAGGVSLNKNIAKAGTDTTTTQTAKISVVDGAQVKYMNNNSDSGMRFNFGLTTAAYNAAYVANASGVEVGALLVPTDVLNGELTIEEAQTEGSQIHKEAFPQSEWVADGDGYSAYAYIYNFTEDAYKRDMTVVGYYTENGATEYTSAVTRSMTYVAAHAYNDPEETNKTALGKYLVDCTVTVGNTATTYKAGNTATVTAEATSGDQIFDGWYVNEEKVSEELNYTFIVDKDVTLEAGYKDPINIATATLSVPEGLKHTGRAVEPTVTVELDGETLVKDTDYTVSYTGDTQNLKSGSDVKYGEATAVVTGIGKYTGTNSLEYKFYSEATAKRIDGDASDWADYNGNTSVIYNQNGTKGVQIKAKMESDGIYVFATAKHATLVSNSGNPKEDTALKIWLAYSGSSIENGYKSVAGFFITEVGNYKEWSTNYENWHGATESAFITSGIEGNYTTNVETFIPSEYLISTPSDLYENGMLKDGIEYRLGFSWMSQKETEKMYVSGEQNRPDWLPTNRWTNTVNENNLITKDCFYYLDKYSTEENAINRGLRLSAQVTQDFAVDGNDGDWATYNGNEEIIINQGNTKGMNVKAKWGSDGIYVLATTRHATLAINTGTLSNDTRLIIPFALQAGDETTYTPLGSIWATATGNYKYWDNTSYTNSNYAGVISEMKTTGTAGNYVTYTEVFIPNTYINQSSTAAYFDENGKALSTTNLRIGFAWGAPNESEYIIGIGGTSTVWTPMQRWTDSLGTSNANVAQFYYLDTNFQDINRGLRYTKHVASDFAVDGDVSDWADYTGTTKTTKLDDGRYINYRAQYGTDGVYFSVEALVNTVVIGNLPSTAVGTAVKNFWTYWYYQTNMELTFGGKAFKMTYGYVRWSADTIGIVENAMRVTEKDGKQYVVMELFIPYAEYATLGITSSDGKKADMTTWVFGCNGGTSTFVTEYETYKYADGSKASTWDSNNRWFGGCYQNTDDTLDTYFEIKEYSLAA